MSQEVLDGQKWLNETYDDKNGYIHVEETGLPGSAMSEALVSAMQIELKMTNITGYFGSATSAVCDDNPLQVGSAGNRVKILQYGLYSKGYDAKGMDGEFDEDTQNAIRWVQEDAGLTGGMVSSIAKGLQLQAVLGVDEYKKVHVGDDKIRGMQQEMNRRYLDYTGLRPCDGIFGRGTNTALIYAIQAEEDLPLPGSGSIYAANGNFGNTTSRCCPSIPYNNAEKDFNDNVYSADEISNFIKLLQFALYCTGHYYTEVGPLVFHHSKYDPGSFNGEFNDSTKNALHEFQKEYALEERDMVGLDEWMALAVSTGNPKRTVHACDTWQRITPEKARALKAGGYEAIGRYLTGDLPLNNVRVAKNLLRPEMKAIFDAGLKLFVIFQDPRQYYTENPNEENIFHYYNESRGYADAEKAFSVAKSLGVPRNEIIYFTVDYDFMETQVKSRVAPYFKGINDYAAKAGNIFRIGIYGSRNTCTIIKKQGYSVSSFVADLSTGYSGNLGYPLPEDWAFDQIREEGTNQFGIPLDFNAKSGRYEGFSGFEKEQDDEWDKISQNGGAFMLTFGKGNAYPLATGSIPLYWAKVKNDDGTFSAKYPMYDQMPVGAFFSKRYKNLNREDSSSDNIDYVYFRDKGGRLNAGYIDSSDMNSGYSDSTHTYGYTYFGETHVTLDKATHTCEANDVYYTPAPSDSQKVSYLLTKALKYYNTAGVLQGTLPAGTHVEVLMVTASGKSYPYMIECTAKMLPDKDVWEYLIPGESRGFIDLGFELGVMPEDRAMISNYR